LPLAVCDESSSRIKQRSSIASEQKLEQNLSKGGKHESMSLTKKLPGEINRPNSLHSDLPLLGSCTSGAMRALSQ
jgi:hypothetical protein